MKGKIKNSELAKDLERHFRKNTDLEIKTTLQKFRIYLKFPILKELGLSRERESDFLFLKIEIFKDFGFCKKYKTEIIPLFKFNKSILVKTLDLSTLMTTKLRAIFFRKWEKKNKKGKILTKVKGRDYFDLMWYLEKGIKPNLSCLEDLGIKDLNELKIKLLEILEKVDPKSIQFDLEALIGDSNFVKNLSKNIKEILKREIEKLS